jgi:hypothetical protein
MQTHSGRRFYPLDPRQEDLNLTDIAHALSHVCRFGGHCRHFYSVAQHSVLVASILPAPLKLAGLLHDATEAYLIDLPTPIKAALPGYKIMEAKLAGLIEAEFGVSFDHPAIHEADRIALVTEARDLIDPSTPRQWGYADAPLPFRISPQSPLVARDEFLRAFFTLTK